jgi:uncharacterized protein YbbK (DUF523 family)
MKYLISACLANQPVRYDGKAYKYEKLLQWIENQKVILACPETLGGLATPRAPAEIVGGTAIDVLSGHACVMDNLHNNVSQAFIDGAYKTLALAQSHHIDIIVLKENSPSCGSHFIYDGSFSGKKIAALGITTALLQQHGFQVMSETEFFEHIALS